MALISGTHGPRAIEAQRTLRGLAAEHLLEHALRRHDGLRRPASRRMRRMIAEPSRSG